MNLDDAMMRRAIRAARHGRPSPNPHVGAVLVRGTRVLSTGYHRRAGEAHAEVMALTRGSGRTRGATMYVTLEPCNHFGRTGPCTEAIERAGVRRVVIGTRDPAPHVPGAVERLRRGGIEVRVGVRQTECRHLVGDFATHIIEKRPYVTVKTASTLDGRSAARSGDARWITGMAARREVHRLRDRSDAVLTGVGTVLADNPQLTVRHVRGRDPLRAVLDSRLRTPANAALFQSGGPVIIFHGKRAPKARKNALVRAGAELVPVPEDRAGLRLRAVLRALAKRDVVRLLVEAGPTLNGALLERKLVDRWLAFIAPSLLGDEQGLPIARGRHVMKMSRALRLASPTLRRVGEDAIFEGYLTDVNRFFSKVGA
ncbi:MAG: bifunctional diaminohydroxyphosphoribosylaminopyrimidine deaminase/5-amino-6-(5-phosphoribosylamino)uracil reductase RibD [Myxococcota bacterium]